MLSTLRSTLFTVFVLFAANAAFAQDNTPTLPGWGNLPGWSGQLPGLPGLPGDGQFPGLPGQPGLPGDGGTTTSANGQTVTGTYQNAAGSRGYSVFIPQKLATNPGLLVVLHGCFMTGDQMAAGTQLNTYAAEKGFVVLYPEQTYSDNSWKCWNWFNPENQQRSGELSILAEMTTTVAQKYSLDSTHIFVTGLSAGGAMASNLLGCYSDIFAGGLIGSGLEFAAAQNATDGQSVTTTPPTRDLAASAQQAYSCSPPRTKLMSVIVVHGKSDTTVNPINGDRIATFFDDLNLLIDKAAGGADALTHTQTTLNQDGGKLSATETDSLFSGQVVVRKIMVDGMGHAWSGGASTAPYMEPRGVDASQILVDAFFN